MLRSFHTTCSTEIERVGGDEATTRRNKTDRDSQHDQTQVSQSSLTAEKRHFVQRLASHKRPFANKPLAPISIQGGEEDGRMR